MIIVRENGEVVMKFTQMDVSKNALDIGDLD
jgi:hypothetical protein